jgi:hypothetical protein
LSKKRRYTPSTIQIIKNHGNITRSQRMEDEKERDGDIDDFLRENTHYLTLIGIFGATSIYISDVGRSVSKIEGGTTEVELGIFASFGIVLVALLTLLLKIGNIIRKERYSIKERLVLGVFGFLLGLLTYSVSTFIFEFDRIIIRIGQSVGITSGIMLSIVTISVGNDFEEKEMAYGVYKNEIILIAMSLFGIVQWLVIWTIDELIMSGQANYISKGELSLEFLAGIIILSSSVWGFMSLIMLIVAISNILYTLSVHIVPSIYHSIQTQGDG